MALGSGPFGLTTFGTTAIAVADQDITSLTSSRSILANGQYELDADGGFVGMDDTRQRVLLLVSYAAGKLPKHISAQTLSEIEGRTRKALAILTKQPNPDIRIKAVAATAVGGTVEILVDYVNLRTGTRQTASKTL
jgi:hypothetical protein